MNKDDFSVSVVIPSVGRNSIYEAIRSVDSQTLPVLEIIIIEDSCVIPVDNLELKTPIYKFKSNGHGVSSSRNMGVEKANGNFIALLDDDDVWVDTKIEKQMQALKSQSLDKSKIIISSRVVRFDDKETHISPEKIYTNGTILHHLYRLSWNRSKFAFYTPTLLFSKDIGLELKFNKDLNIREDIDFLLRAELSGIRMVQLSEPLCAVSYEPSRSWQRETLKLYFKWIKYLSTYKIRAAVSFALGVGIRTLFFKYVSNFFRRLNSR